MTSPSTACPSCGEDVPFGRRTCEACGANVAVIAHEEVPQAEAATDDEGWDVRKEVLFEPYPEPQPTALESAPAAVEPEPAAFESPPAPAAPEPALEPAAPAPELEASAPEPSSTPFMPPVLREWNPGSNVPETGFAAELAAASAEAPGLAGAWLPPASGPREPTAPTTPRWPENVAVAAATNTLAHERETMPPPASAPAASAEPVVPPGPVPASLAEMLDRSGTAAPRWPAAIERAATLDPGAAAAASSAMPPATALAASIAPDRKPLEPGRAPLFADLPFDAPNTVPGWLVAAGGGIATIGFLLPWVPVLDSYFGAWGLNSISNLPAFLLVFGITALAILPSRLADWLRHGILGLAVGAFILGLTWSRLVGASGGQIGVVLEGAGALLLLIGGILAIVRDRGASDGRTGPR